MVKKDNSVKSGEKCSKCSKCCNSLIEKGVFIMPISRKCLKKIRETKKFKELKNNDRIFIRKSSIDPYYPLEFYAPGGCPFLNRSNNCVIYPQRPPICKNFWCT